MSEGLLIAITRPLTLNESVGIEPANIRRSIRTIGIHHDDLGAPSETLKAGFDSVLLIETDDNRGNFCRSYFTACSFLHGRIFTGRVERGSPLAIWLAVNGATGRSLHFALAGR